MIFAFEEIVGDFDSVGQGSKKNSGGVNSNILNTGPVIKQDVEA